MYFHVFMRKLVLQTRAEQLMSGVEFQIDELDQKEI